MQIVYSPSSHLNEENLSNGFYFQGSSAVPADSFPVQSQDHDAAINLPVGATYTFTAPVSPNMFGTLIVQNASNDFLLQQAKNIQISLIQAAYQAAINSSIQFTNSAGVASSYPSGNSIALNGQTAMQNLNNAIALGASGWTLGKWLDINCIAQVFSFSDLQKLADTMGSIIQADWTDLVGKISEIQSATTISAVQSVTF